SDILLTYKSMQGTGNIIFGDVTSNLLAKSKQAITSSKILQPLNSFKRILVVLSPNAELEHGFIKVSLKIHSVLKQLGNTANVYGEENTIKEFSQAIGDRRRGFYNYFSSENLEEFDIFNDIKEDDLIVILSARKQTL